MPFFSRREEGPCVANALVARRFVRYGRVVVLRNSFLTVTARARQACPSAYNVRNTNTDYEVNYERARKVRLSKERPWLRRLRWLSML